MKVRNWLFVLICLVSCSTFISGCSTQAQPSIVGQWEARMVPGEDYPEAMEVFENGTLVLQMHDRFVTSKYELKDGAIIIGNSELTVAALTKSSVVLAEPSGDNALVFDRIDD